MYLVLGVANFKKLSLKELYYFKEQLIPIDHYQFGSNLEIEQQIQI